jgi:hypothetical protein
MACAGQPTVWNSTTLFWADLHFIFLIIVSHSDLDVARTGFLRFYCIAILCWHSLCVTIFYVSVVAVGPGRGPHRLFEALLHRHFMLAFIMCYHIFCLWLQSDLDVARTGFLRLYCIVVAGAPFGLPKMSHIKGFQMVKDHTNFSYCNSRAPRAVFLYHLVLRLYGILCCVSIAPRTAFV